VPVSQQRIADDAVVYIYIESTSTVLLNWLYRVKIPSILKKIKAGVVVDLNGVASDTIKIPQLVATAPFLFNKDVRKLNGIEKFALKNFSILRRVLKTFCCIQKKDKMIFPILPRRNCMQFHLLHLLFLKHLNGMRR
jgi:hypothetical protein